MKKAENIKLYLLIDCYAFTVVTLANALFVLLGVVEVFPVTYTLYIFLVTTIIAGLMFLSDSILRDKEELKTFFQLIDIIVPCLMFSYFIGNAQFSIGKLITNLIFYGIIYLLVRMMLYLSWREKDSKLNERIQEMRSKNRQ